MEQFSIDWWLAYQKTWNQQAELGKKFARLGKVIFSFLNNEEISVCLEWDENGKIIKVEEVNNTDINVPIFSATQENWQKFIAQEIKAAPAVMPGKIKYQGSFTIILKCRLNTLTLGFLGIVGVLVAGLLAIIGKVVFFPKI